jgi:hypothetical protein
MQSAKQNKGNVIAMLLGVQIDAKTIKNHQGKPRKFMLSLT